MSVSSTRAGTPGRVRTAPVPARRRPRRAGIERRRTRAALGFLAPALTILGVFVLWPMVRAVGMSMTDASLFGDSQWVGLANYERLIVDDRFRNALANTAEYTLVTAPVSVAIALWLAILLDQRIPWRQFFRAVFFLPFVAALSLVSIGWSFLLDPQVGFLAVALQDLGVPIGSGVRDPRWAMPAVMTVGIWRNVGFFMVMFLAGLQSIPAELKEAVLIDGAGRWQRFRHLTWPLLSNTTMFVTIIAAIFSFQAFDQMYVMTSGGPFFQTETLVMHIYSRGFEAFQMGYAAAISWVLVAIVLAFSLLQLAYFNKRVVRY